MLLSRYQVTTSHFNHLNYSVVLAQPLFTERLVRLNEDESSIQLDGFLDEAVWKEIPAFDGMRVINPDTLAKTPYKTDIRLFYTERGILHWRKESSACRYSRSKNDS